MSTEQLGSVNCSGLLVSSWPPSSGLLGNLFSSLTSRTNTVRVHLTNCLKETRNFLFGVLFANQAPPRPVNGDRLCRTTWPQDTNEEQVSPSTSEARRFQQFKFLWHAAAEPQPPYRQVQSVQSSPGSPVQRSQRRWFQYSSVWIL